MNIVVGSSRTRDLDKVEPLKSNETVEVWTRPGGRYADMKALIDQHLIYHHGGPNLNHGQSHVYVVAGLCDITEKIKNKNSHYQEIIFRENPEIAITRIKSSIKDLQSYILSQNLIPIFCTIVPSHLEKQNLHSFDKGYTDHLDFISQYHNMQDEAMKVFEHLNTHIPIINSSLNMATPNVHNSVFHNKSGGKKYFQFSKLADGCHPTSELKTIWAKHIDRAIKENRK